MTTINLALNEIYAALCAECKAKIVKMVGEKLTEAQIKEALEKPPPGDKPSS
jgi:hypothetical protein